MRSARTSTAGAADVIARYVPVNERARATSFVFGGLNMGTIAGLTIAPTLIESLAKEVWKAWYGGVVRSGDRALFSPC